MGAFAATSPARAMAKACAIIASLDPPAMNTDEAGNPPLVRTRVRHVHAGSAAAVQHEHDGARRSVQDRGNVHAILAGGAGHGTRVISEPQRVRCRHLRGRGSGTARVAAATARQRLQDRREQHGQR